MKEKYAVFFRVRHNLVRLLRKAGRVLIVLPLLLCAGISAAVSLPLWLAYCLSKIMGLGRRC